MNRRLSFAALLGSILVIPLMGEETVASCRPDFLSASRYAMSGTPLMISTADLNGDGLPDVVTAVGNYSQAISVRLGQPDGSFGPMINQATNDSVQFAVVGNFTNDTVPDLIYSSYSSISFFKGNGDGTFQNGVGLGVAPLNYLQAADVDGDGKLDLVGVEAQFSNNRIAVLLGNGDGTFQPPIYTTPKNYPGAIAVGDLNGDGKADLVLTSSDSNVYVYLGLGNGQFAAPTPFVAGGNQRAVVVADVTGEGTPDILVVADIYLAVLVGNGDGTFQAALDYPAGPAPQNVVLTDLNGDGAVDVAVLNGPFYYGSLSSVFVLLNAGGGVFNQGVPYFAAYGYSTAVAAADFGNAGRSDLALGGQDNFVSVVRGNGDGTLNAVRLSPTSFQGGSAPNGLLATGDLNGDGIPDAVLSTSYSIRPFLAAGGGVFAPGTEVLLNGSSVVGLAAGDFNGDGQLDLAVVFDIANSIEILLGQGDGTFVQTPLIPIPDFTGYGQSLAVGDFDGDGKLDLAVTKTDFSNTLFALFVFPGIGDGTFGTPTETGLTATATQLLAADFNGDGKADLAAINSYPSTVLDVFLSQGGGTFQPAVPYAMSDGARGMTAADLRHSGHLDLVVGNANHNTLTILPGHGDGSFGTPSIIGLGSPVAQVVAADFDGDGNLDLLTANLSGDASALFGLGNGAFQSPKEYPVGTPVTVAAGDFDGNGTPDALFVNSDGALGISVLLNGRLGAAVPATSVLVNDPGAITVRASGYGPLSYQWRKSGIPLADGGSISGVTTATLTIDPATFADANTYDVLVTDACGTLASAPGTLSVEFADVPTTSIFHDDIITIATAGITAGCGGSNYCPASLVSRAQMAVFLLKSEHGSSYVPPACTGVFADVACPSPFADWIERLAAEGVTAGCGGNNYCPDATVTRAQMSVFLLKTKQGSAYVPPPAAGIFGDVPVGSFAADWIEDLYSRGIAGGCSASPLLYCPGNPVNRAQMAAFLVNTFF
jgi:hypothetical protein